MGKIDAIKIIDKEIISAVDRIQANLVNPSKNDIFFLTDKYNECNTSHYSHRDVSICNDCRRYVFNFWLNVVNGQR